MGTDERITELERELIDVRIRLSRLERELLRRAADDEPMPPQTPPGEPKSGGTVTRVPWLRAVEGPEDQDGPDT